MGFFDKLNHGMKKTRDNFSGNIDQVLDSFDAIDEDLYDELIEVLVMGDVGVYTAEEIVEQTKQQVKKQGITDPAKVRSVMKQVVADMLGEDQTIDFLTTPAVILVIGVNGVGKTTTIGKMANYFKSQGKKVVLGAADTFRAAAIDQLQIWADRAQVDLVAHDEGADPAAVVFDTINAGIARNADIIICDTAGRIHNKQNLMNELNKIFRVIDRELPYSDREIFLVLDATTGQNAINQAKEFMKVAEVSGIVLTKLDGTARGGVVLAVHNELKLPVKFIGVGEGIDDLQPFSASGFAESLFDTISEEEKQRLEAKLEENLQVSNIAETYAVELTEEEQKKLEEKAAKEQAKAEKQAAKEAAAAEQAAAEEKARRKAEQKAKEQAKKEARAKQLEEEAAQKAAAEAEARLAAAEAAVAAEGKTVFEDGVEYFVEEPEEKEEPVPSTEPDFSSMTRKERKAWKKAEKARKDAEMEAKIAAAKERLAAKRAEEEGNQ